MDRIAGKPAGVVAAAAFFAAAGLLDLGLAIVLGSHPLSFWRVWEALGRCLLDLAVAYGLWRQVALCRSVAMVYCLAAIATYAAVLALAFVHAPFAYPRTIVYQSLFEVPSCALLYPWLRTSEASAAFPRPLFGPPAPGRPREH